MNTLEQHSTYLCPCCAKPLMEFYNEDTRWNLYCHHGCLDVTNNGGEGLTRQDAFEVLADNYYSEEARIRQEKRDHERLMESAFARTLKWYSQLK